MENLSKQQLLLYEKFLQKFMEIENKQFDINKDSYTIEKLKVFIYYFTNDKRFFELKSLHTKDSKPSFDKGLLIMGGIGSGKTSMLRAMHSALKDLHYYFILKNSIEIVIEYESLPSEAKSNFFNGLKNGKWAFDDVLNEGTANNFGKIELFEKILFLRHFHKNKTFITCNYHTEFPFDIEEGLFQYYSKYGDRVYDRLFEMFNIIEFRGKSMRR